jgi:acylphosphatase
MQQRMSAIVYGRVQGVAFRAHAEDEARRLGVTGWVANQRDGSVRVEAEGTDAALHSLESWLHKGPPAAAVTKVDVTWSRSTGEFDSFQVRN